MITIGQGVALLGLGICVGWITEDLAHATRARRPPHHNPFVLGGIETAEPRRPSAGLGSDPEKRSEPAVSLGPGDPGWRIESPAVCFWTAFGLWFAPGGAAMALVKHEPALALALAWGGLVCWCALSSSGPGSSAS